MKPYASKGHKMFLETQKWLGKSGIRTHDPKKTKSYIVKRTLFNFNFLNAMWDYVDGTKTQYRSEM